MARAIARAAADACFERVMDHLARQKFIMAIDETRLLGIKSMHREKQCRQSR